MAKPLEIRRDLLPAGEWPEHLVDEVGVAQFMFDRLVEGKLPSELVDGFITVLAYIVAFREGARRLFFVQDMMNWRDAGKDGVERLAIAAIMGGADEIVMVSEAWMVRSDERDLESVRRWLVDHGSLREHPGATERLTVQHFAQGGDIVAAAEIRRSSDGPRLVDWVAQRQKVDRGQGRFQNFFLKAQSLLGENS